MNLTELVEQLVLLKQDHPHSANLQVRANDMDVFATNINNVGDQEFVEIECWRPYAITN